MNNDEIYLKDLLIKLLDYKAFLLKKKFVIIIISFMAHKNLALIRGEMTRL